MGRKRQREKDLSPVSPKGEKPRPFSNRIFLENSTRRWCRKE